MEKTVIKIENLSKDYKIYDRKIDRLLEVLFPFYKKHKLFKALDNISFEVKKGEILGIIGKNGAGKSTILKIITGIVAQTCGNVTVDGRISSLLELGTSFNPELTGRENIYLHGQVNGLSNEEIKVREDEIIDFADIGDHIEQPVKTYSSGMFARLAFACAMNVDPDILIVDEVLSVGDMRFQEKSITKMKEIRNKGTTILFVSHSLPAIRNFCDNAIWLENGAMKMSGTAADITEKYKDYMLDDLIKRPINHKQKEKNIEILFVNTNKTKYKKDEDIVISIGVKNSGKVKKFGVGVILENNKNEIVSTLNTVREDALVDGKKSSIKLVIKDNKLCEGIYYITVSICDETIMFSYDRNDYATNFNIEGKKNKRGIEIVGGIYSCDHEWDIR